MISQLAKKQCQPCEKHSPTLTADELHDLSQQLSEGWKVVNGHHLEKEYVFKGFREALDFTNRVGQVAEQQGHHPDIYLGWGKVRLQIWTHTIDGLSENDFILAAKADVVR